MGVEHSYPRLSSQPSVCYHVSIAAWKPTLLTNILGDLCGAIFVDERFKALVIRKLQEISEDAMARVSDGQIQTIMSQNWENEIRSQFSGAAKTWTIHVPYSLIDADLLDPNHGHPTFTITSAEIEEVFRPIVKKIYSLVNRQIEAAVKKEGRAPKVRITSRAWLCLSACPY